MPDANLYLDRIDFECHKCGPQSCKKLVEKIKAQLPRVPALQLPRPVPLLRDNWTYLRS